MFLENKMVDDRISRAIDNDHTAAMKAPGDSKKHMRKKGPSGDMISVCMTCKKAFKNPLFYRKHMRLHAEKTISCHLCGKTFERKHYLQTHLQSHSQAHTKHHFQCSICHKRFSQKGHLNQHLKFHVAAGGQSKYKCNTCEKDFFHQEHLRTHLRNHRDERPFECETCHKRFNIKSSLQRHMSCHTGEKPFLCAICNRGYTRRSVLVLHIQQVHENRKPFQCEECQLCFSQKGNLQAHFRRKHLQPKSSDSSKRVKEGKSKRGHKRQRPNPSKAIKICANKNYIPSEEARPRVDNTSLHSYASKVKAIVNRGAKAPNKSPKSGSSSCEEEGSFYGLSSLESSSSCSMSDEAAAGSSSGDDIPETMPAVSLGFPIATNFEGPSEGGPYDIKSLSEFESLLDIKEWEENFITDSDNMLCSLLPNYDLNDALTSPSKSNIVLTKASVDMPDDMYSAGTWSDYPLFTAEDLDEIKDIGGTNYFIQNGVRISQNSKTVNHSNFAIQKLNFSPSSSLQA